jgi:hypothetical protein
MKDSTARTEIRVLAALLLSTRDDIDPESLFYANVALLTTPNIFGLWAEGVETFLSDIICEAWSRATKHQRFALRATNLTVPAITRAFDSETIGFQKAASVVVAARHAVQTGLDDSLLLRLEEMSASTKHPASIGPTP